MRTPVKALDILERPLVGAVRDQAEFLVPFKAPTTGAAKATLRFLSPQEPVPELNIPHVPGTTAGVAMSSFVLAIIDLRKKSL